MLPLGSWKLILLVALFFGLAAGLFGPAEDLNDEASCGCAFKPGTLTQADGAPRKPIHDVR
ncbi:MAG: hypothetical protein KBI47_10885 [Armatimonadetes bacterium]|jgi:hypothetical protein|nr:hypothetical protein [Armatimonadota bacterium]